MFNRPVGHKKKLMIQNSETPSTYTTLDDVLAELSAIRAEIATLKQPNTPNFEREYMTTEEAAKYLNLARASIYRLVWEGKLPHYKFGKYLHFKKDDLAAFLANGKRNAYTPEQ